MKIHTRIAKIEDINRIAEITHEFDQQSLDGYINAFKKQVEQNFEKESCAYIFVALIDNFIVGHGKLLNYKKDRLDVDYPSPEGWYLNGIIVDPKFRRLGVAKALLHFREQFAVEKNDINDLFSIVAADNIPSIQYHQKLGLKEVRRAPGFLKIKLHCGEGILFHKMLDNMI